MKDSRRTWSLEKWWSESGEALAFSTFGHDTKVLVLVLVLALVKTKRQGELASCP